MYANVYLCCRSMEESLTCDGDKVTKKQKFKIKLLNDDHWINEIRKGMKGMSPAEHIKESGYSNKECDAFLKYANKNIAEFKDTKTIKMSRFKAGCSSSPYLIEANDKKYVLKVPNSKQIQGFHCWSMTKANCNLELRYKIMDLLNRKTCLPVPQMIHFCGDDRVIGKQFILMEYVEGKMYSVGKQPKNIQQKMRDSFYKLAIDLHSIDIYKIGIWELFKSYGYEFEREKRNSINFLNHFSNERNANNKYAAYLNFRDALYEYHQKHKIGAMESKLKCSLLHNDIHGDQVLWDLKDGKVKIVALLDWEFPDIGIPLLELGWMSHVKCIGDGTEIIEKYVQSEKLAMSGQERKICIELIDEHWDYYVALDFFKWIMYSEWHVKNGLKRLETKKCSEMEG